MSEPVDAVLDFLEDWALQKNLKIKNGEIKKAGRPATVQKLYADFTLDLSQKIPTAAPLSISDFNTILTGYLEDKREIFDHVFNIPTVETVADFVPETVRRLGIYVSPLGDEITDPHGRSMSYAELETIITCEAYKYNEESHAQGETLRKPLLVGAVKDFIRREIQEKASRHWAELRANLVFKRELADYPDAYIGAILKAFDFQGDHELNLAVWKQWIWQTKRYFMSLPVSDPLMVNLYAAKGGGGKSQIVKKICEPLEEYMAGAVLSVILDSREFSLFTDRYIVFFDELSLGKIDHGQVGPLLAGLRKLITDDKITQRNMRETSHTKKRRTFSPISTSNKPLNEVLPDDSGMRRFFEMEMLAEKDNSRIAKLRAMNTLAIWQGIDESLPRGYIVEGTPIWYKLQEHQANLKYRSIFDEVLDDLPEKEVRTDDPEVAELARLAEAANSHEDLERELAQFEIIPYKSHSFRRLLIDHCESEFDKYLSRYIPTGTRLITELEARGFFIVTTSKKSTLVFLRTNKEGGGYV